MKINNTEIESLWRKTALWSVLLLPAVACGTAHGQDARNPLSWEDCIAIAAKNNPDLASSRFAVDAGKATYYGSFNGLLPKLGLSNSYNDSQDSIGASKWQAQATASLDLWNPAKIADVKSASASLRQAQASLRQSLASLRFNLRRAFAQFLLSQEKIKVAQQIKEIREKGARMVELRYRSGRESLGNMLRTQALSLQAEASLAQAVRDLDTARISLARQLGDDEFQVSTASGSLTGKEPPDMSADLKQLLTSRPDVAVQEAAIQSAEASLRQAQSPIWPTLSANYARSYWDRTEFPSARTNWTFSTILSYPLFGGGPTATYFSASSAKKSLRKSQEDLRAVRSQALVDLASARADFSTAVDQVRVETAMLEAARQRNDESDVRYASGLLSYDNWEIIVTDRVNEENQSLQAHYNAAVAEAGWDKAVGKGLGEL